MALDHLCSGASPCPECDPQAYLASCGDGGLTPGQAARIADEIMADDAPSSTPPKRASVSGIPQGYGSPRSIY